MMTRALISFIEKMASVTNTRTVVELRLRHSLGASDDRKVLAVFGDTPIEDKAAREIDKKVRDSNLMFLYNSTIRNEPIYFSGGRRRRFMICDLGRGKNSPSMRPGKGLTEPCAKSPSSIQRA